MTTTALILIDIQNDYFPGGKWPVYGMEAAARNAARLLAHGRENGMAIFHVRHEIQSQSAPFFVPDSHGAQINALVRPKGEPVILKHRPNSFLATELEVRLRDAGIEGVILCGAMSQMCVDSTARAACDLGFGVTVAHDACAARALDYGGEFGGTHVAADMVHAAFMAALCPTFAHLKSTDEIVAPAPGQPRSGLPGKAFGNAHHLVGAHRWAIISRPRR